MSVTLPQAQDSTPATRTLQVTTIDDRHGNRLWLLPGVISEGHRRLTTPRPPNDYELQHLLEYVRRVLSHAEPDEADYKLEPAALPWIIQIHYPRDLPEMYKRALLKSILYLFEKTFRVITADPPT